MINKTKLTLGLAMSAIMLATVLAPQDAMAHKRKHRHSHHRTHHSASSYSASSALASKVEMLEAQLRATQDEVTALRSAGGQGAAVADSSKVQELDAWMQESKAKPAAEKKHMVFFRGGYGHNNDSGREGTVDPTSHPLLGPAANGLVVGSIADNDAWYFGAGFDFSLSDDLFGMWDNTEVLAELMFDYKQLAERQPNGLSPQAVATLAALGYNIPPANTETATVNQLTLAASPKIKFFKGSKFRPWLIPVGFELNVISPPSDAITVLNPGMQFGFGADYNIWRNLYVGADARYHLTLGDMDGVNTDGVTAGGYLGIGF